MTAPATTPAPGRSAALAVLVACGLGVVLGPVLAGLAWLDGTVGRTALGIAGCA